MTADRSDGLTAFHLGLLGSSDVTHLVEPLTEPVPNSADLRPPVVSIVIPARDSAPTLAATLRSIAALETAVALEVLVVDDGSTDQTASLAAAAGARVIPCDGRGVADARNTGARAARGRLLLFVDSDVVLPPHAIDRIVARIQVDGYDAVTGRLSHVHRHSGFASQYKNLWMAYTYETLPDEVALFYTSAAAIRRDLFLDLGGFARHFQRPSVEDTAFGQLLGDRGHRVRAEKELAVEHLKTYDVAGVLRLDFARARDLTVVFIERARLSLRRGNTSSVPTSFMASLPLPPLAIAMMLSFLVTGRPLPLALAAASLTFFWCLNVGFLTYLLRHRGVGFLARAHVFMPLDALAVTAGIAASLVELVRRPKAGR